MDDHNQTGRQLIESLATVGISITEVRNILKQLQTPQVIPSLFRIIGKIDKSIQIDVAKTVDRLVDSIIAIWFGYDKAESLVLPAILLNPDISELSTRLPNLMYIIISPDICNLRSVEQFITYAVNNIGQKHLKECTAVLIYDDVDKLTSNLYNALSNLCNSIKIIEDGNEIFELVQSKNVERGFLPKHKTLINGMLCWLGLHKWDRWQHFSSNSHVQLRQCQRCNRKEYRIVEEHTWRE